MAAWKQIASIGLVILGFYFMLTANWATGTAIDGYTQADMHHNMLNMIPIGICAVGIAALNYREMVRS